MHGREILRTKAFVLPEADLPIRISEYDHVQVCSEARERKVVEALEFKANTPPSLSPSPPSMDMDDVHEGPGGAGPSELPEGHELEAGGDAAEGSDSGETDATDNNLTALERSAGNNTTAMTQPLSPVTELRIEETEWNVSLCQTPKLGPPLPTSARPAQIVILIEPGFDQDLLYSTFVSRMLSRCEYIDDYAANAGNYSSPHPLQSIIRTRVSDVIDRTVPGSKALLGVRLTTVEPPCAGASDASKRRLSTGGEGSSSGLHGDATLSTAPLSKARRAETPNEADDVEADANDAEPESPAAAGSDEDNDAESGSKSGHEASGADDAESPLRSAEASNAEGGSKAGDDLSHADDAKAESSADPAETPASADDAEGITQADGDLGPESLALTPPPDEQDLEIQRHQVRMCRTPEVCLTLPPEATSARELPIRTCPAEDYDTITATTLRLLMVPVDQAEDYAALAEEVTSRYTSLVFNQVAWVEINDNGRKSVVRVRVMRCTEGQPFSRPGLGLTTATYRRVKNGLCSAIPPMILPREFQRLLDAIAQHLHATIKNADIATAGPSATAEEAGVIAEDVDTATAEPSATAEGTNAVAKPADVAAAEPSAITAEEAGVIPEEADTSAAESSATAEETSAVAEPADVVAAEPSTATEEADAVTQNADTATAKSNTMAEEASVTAENADLDASLPHTAAEETNTVNQKIDVVTEETPTPEAAENTVEPTSGAQCAPSTRSLPGKPT
eukprot:6195732-Pleurochrysis_carterae.AAC.1